MEGALCLLLPCSPPILPTKAPTVLCTWLPPPPVLQGLVASSKPAGRAALSLSGVALPQVRQE